MAASILQHVNGVVSVPAGTMPGDTGVVVTVTATFASDISQGSHIAIYRYTDDNQETTSDMYTGASLSIAGTTYPDSNYLLPHATLPLHIDGISSPSQMSFAATKAEEAGSPGTTGRKTVVWTFTVGTYGSALTGSTPVYAMLVAEFTGFSGDISLDSWAHYTKSAGGLNINTVISADATASNAVAAGICFASMMQIVTGASEPTVVNSYPGVTDTTFTSIENIAGLAPNVGDTTWIVGGYKTTAAGDALVNLADIELDSFDQTRLGHGADGSINYEWLSHIANITGVLRGSLVDVCIMPRGQLGHGRRITGDGTNLSQSEYFSVYAHSEEDTLANIATGRHPCGYRDGSGVWHLWYDRSGRIYYRTDIGSGWGSEANIMAGSSPAVASMPLGITLMSFIEGSHCKVVLWRKTGSLTSPALSEDTATIVDLGAADSASGTACEMLPDGTLQVWWFDGGTQQSKTSVDGGTTWA